METVHVAFYKCDFRGVLFTQIVMSVSQDSLNWASPLRGRHGRRYTFFYAVSCLWKKTKRLSSITKDTKMPFWGISQLFHGCRPRIIWSCRRQNTAWLKHTLIYPQKCVHRYSLSHSWFVYSFQREEQKWQNSDIFFPSKLSDKPPFRDIIFFFTPQRRISEWVHSSYVCVSTRRHTHTCFYNFNPLCVYFTMFMTLKAPDGALLFLIETVY